LEPSDLDACGGSVAQLSAAVDDALARAGITAAP
jgi:hypothetical protein